MRLRLTIEQAKPRQLIPVNYHYYISSYIYKTILEASTKLHIFALFSLPNENNARKMRKNIINNNAPINLKLLDE